MKTNYNTMSDNLSLQLCRRNGFVIALCLFCSGIFYAQDNIVLKTGVEIQAKVIEISETYVKFEDQNGASLMMPVSDIFMIKYQDGTKDIFETKLAAQQKPVRAKTPAASVDRFEPDSSDFAWIKKKNYSGPRVGLTSIAPGTTADYLEKNGKRPVLTQFGWQFEGRLFTVEETSGIVEFVPMIGGLEQGMFIPSVNLLIGIRSGKKIPVEFAMGPNFSVGASYQGNKQGFAGLVIAVGTSFKKGNINFPVTLAFVPSVGSVTEVTDETSGAKHSVTHHTGSRISLIIGYNTRRR